MGWVIRDRIPAEDDDFIYSSWLKSYKSDSIHGRRMSNDLFYSGHHDVVERLLERSKTLMACWQKDGGTLAGFLTYEKDEKGLILHYAFTKFKLRGLGIFSDLLDTIQADSGKPRFSHWTDGGKTSEYDGGMTRFIRKRPHWEYEPYAAYRA